jgi:Zn-dependent protease with chaperone function
MPGQFEATFFDGRSAEAHIAAVEFLADGVEIIVGGARRMWNYRFIEAHPAADALRLTCRRDPDALLLFSGAARSAFAEAAPDICSGARGRRRLGVAVIGMAALAASVAALVFIGAPAASGPLAKATPRDIEATLGANVAAQIELIFDTCGAPDAVAAFDPALDELIAASEPGFEISFAILDVELPNAMALPGGQLYATRGLIDAVGDDQEAFFAVMAHELGHVKNRDGLKAMYRNYGGAVLLEAITGGSGVAQQAVMMASQLDQLRHSRKQEAEADEAAFNALDRAGLDPSAMGRAFEAIGAAMPQDVDIPAEPEVSPRWKRVGDWLASHPNTDERIKAARARKKDSVRKLMSDEDWARFAAACKGAPEDKTKAAE